MENATDGLKIAVAVIIVAAVIGMVFFIVNRGTDMFNQGTSQLDATLSSLSDADKKVYDNSTVTGTEVINAIKKYVDVDGVYVIVNTKKGDVRVYDNTVGKNAAGVTEELATIYATSWNVSGFPDKYNDGTATLKAITPKPETPPADSSPFGKFETPTREDGQYDATLSKNEKAYISTSASFTASIQVDQNNEVRFITFVQK